jgi:hypothetical protein
MDEEHISSQSKQKVILYENKMYFKERMVYFLFDINFFWDLSKFMGLNI